MSICEEIVHVGSSTGPRVHQIAHLTIATRLLCEFHAAGSLPCSREQLEGRPAAARNRGPLRAGLCLEVRTCNDHSRSSIFCLYRNFSRLEQHLQSRRSGRRDLAPATQRVPLKIDQDINTVRPDSLDTLAVPRGVEVDERGSGCADGFARA